MTPCGDGAGLAAGGVAQQEKTRLGAASGRLFNVAKAAEGGFWGFIPQVEHCHDLGLGGAQTTLGRALSWTGEELRKKVEGYGMQLILECCHAAGRRGPGVQVRGGAGGGGKAAGSLLSPRRDTDCGVGNRYDSLEAFRKDFQRVRNSVCRGRAMPAQVKQDQAGHRKSQRLARGGAAAWLKRLDSEWVGVCLDLAKQHCRCAKIPWTR